MSGVLGMSVASARIFMGKDAKVSGRYQQIPSYVAAMRFDVPALTRSMT